MQKSIFGEGWKFRDKEPENLNEVISLFISEVKEFRNWATKVSPERKKSKFWECDYEEQLYLDVACELLFIKFRDLQKLPKIIVEELIYIIARNYEQGNYVAWMNKNDNKISYNGMSENQFRFLASQINASTEAAFKFQIATAYRKLSNYHHKDFDIINSLINDKNEHISTESRITLMKMNKKQISVEKDEALREKKFNFLKKYIFQGLKNVNDGFDSKSIFYFSEPDFKIILDRVEELNLEVFGIEPWLDGEFYDVKCHEEYELAPNNPNWYRKAFEEFKMKNKNLQYAGTYGIPKKLLT